MAKKYAAAVDQGTTSTRFMIFDHAGQVAGVDQMEHEQIYPQAGWVEHDPMEIWARTQDVIKAGLEKSGVKAEEIASIAAFLLSADTGYITGQVIQVDGGLAM